MVPTEQRLFAPGTGAMPPELSGRGAQQAVLSRCLADLVGGSAPPHNVVLLGPHGNGKTVLLHWLKAACVDVPAVEVLSLTPQDIPAPAALFPALLPRRGLAKLLPRKVRNGSAGPAGHHLSKELALPTQRGRHRLRPRHRQRPPVLGHQRRHGSIRRLRGTQPPQLHVASAKPVAAGGMERRHSVADDLCAGTRSRVGGITGFRTGSMMVDLPSAVQDSLTRLSESSYRTSAAVFAGREGEFRRARLCRARRTTPRRHPLAHANKHFNQPQAGLHTALSTSSSNAELMLTSSGLRLSFSLNSASQVARHLIVNL